MKKKFVPLLLILALCLSGCHKMVEDDGQLLLYASFYPIYALALGVTQDVPDTTVRCLAQPQDGCIRSYELSQWDAGLLSGADALILGGQGLESFAQSLSGGDLPLITLLDGLDLEGTPSADGAESHWQGVNPWLFLDPAGALDMCRCLAGALEALDPGNARQYQDNLAAMETRLNALSRQMSLPQGAQVAVMHEGLTYLARAMNLSVCAQVERESAAALSDNELETAVQALTESGAQAVLIERQAPQSLLRALEDAGFAVARIDTLTAHTEPDAQRYFTAMEENAQAVRQALSRAGALPSETA